MLATGVLRAKPLCILAHAATEAGAKGVEDLAVAPGLASGNYSKHLNLILGFGDLDDTLDVKNIDVPIFNKS